MKIHHLLGFIIVSLLLIFNFPLLAQNTEPVTDLQISDDIVGKIKADDSLKTDNIQVDVTTKDHVVTLTGVVNSESEASTLVILAESTPNVKDVDTTNLIVKASKQPLTDMYITAKVKGTFIREKIFGSTPITPMSIHVETNNGVVYLTGTAETREQVDNAIRLARMISGVVNVRYRIQLTKGEIINLESDH